MKKLKKERNQVLIRVDDSMFYALNNVTNSYKRNNYIIEVLKSDPEIERKINEFKQRKNMDNMPLLPFMQQ